MIVRATGRPSMVMSLLVHELAYSQQDMKPVEWWRYSLFEMSRLGSITCRIQSAYGCAAIVHMTSSKWGYSLVNIVYTPGHVLNTSGSKCIVLINVSSRSNTTVYLLCSEIYGGSKNWRRLRRWAPTESNTRGSLSGFSQYGIRLHLFGSRIVIILSGCFLITGSNNESKGLSSLL